MRSNTKTDFDVIILGTGIAGTILGTILARRGRSVLMVDGGTHPRFAIGESTIPHTSQLLSLLSREHDVPELHYLGLGSPAQLREHVTRNCGVKEIFGFVYHRPGEEHDPAEAHQFGNVWRPENHFFRQDIDSYLLLTAIRYGAYAVQQVKVDDVDIRDEGVSVHAGGTEYTSKFVVDGTGFRSVLANKFALREEPCTLHTTTRTIFTHMVDVTPFEEVAPTAMAQKWSRATLHHCFGRGWFWVIPFNNWDGAPNKLVSVGLTVDQRHHPENAKLSPEGEFEQFLDRFPSVSRQFKDAKVVRPWIRTKRIQYNSNKTVGYRWALLSHAAGFIDPLFSRGMVNTMDNIRSLSRELLAALSDDDFSETRFDHVDQEQNRNVQYHDKVVAGSYISWDHFDLWDAWVRLWGVGVHDTESRLASLLLSLGNNPRFKPTENPIASEYEGPNYRSLFETMWADILRYEQNEITLSEARTRLWDSMRNYSFELPLGQNLDDSQPLQGQEWAMTYPLCRDLYLGVSEKHERWVRGLPDDHLQPSQ